MNTLRFAVITAFFIVLAFSHVPAFAASDQEKIKVFACEPEWAALAQEIGGDKVKPFSATSAMQNPHYIRARPSLISKMRKADLLLCSGASLEIGWLPILLKKASSDLQPGSIGYIMASQLVNMLEVPVVVDRSMGDIHPEGNPHVHLNPYNLIIVGETLADRLSSIDPENASFYKDNYQDFSSRFSTAISRWESEAATLKGKPVVVHHQSFVYLLDWLGMNRVGTLEPKPGIPPTTSHLKNLLQQLRSSPADVIIRTPYDPDGASEWLSEKTETRAIVLPYTIGGNEQSGDLFGLFENTIALLKETYDVKR
ncbi:MAG: zinc ABC transporter substrate-binding protein [Candidatus Dadabacteria bacterium]|nr:zinc ABC transporter substrate-binding protein [Candidatus Dadabacteria bacterium]